MPATLWHKCQVAGGRWQVPVVAGSGISLFWEKEQKAMPKIKVNVSCSVALQSKVLWVPIFS